MTGYFKRMPELYDSSYYLALLEEKAKQIKNENSLDFLQAIKKFNYDQNKSIFT